jgi:hypothetical protein
MLAAATALSRLVPVLDRPVRQAGSSLVQEIVTRAPRLTGPQWRTRARLVTPAKVQGYEWDQAGRLRVAFAAGRLKGKAVLAGLRRGGLDDNSASRIVKTVEGLVGAEGARVVLLTTDSHDPVVSIMVPSKALDASAELLRRGLIQLDVSDQAVLKLQPTLVRAAQQALLDPQARASKAVSDEAYQKAIGALGAQIGTVL